MSSVQEIECSLRVADTKNGDSGSNAKAAEGGGVALAAKTTTMTSWTI